MSGRLTVHDIAALERARDLVRNHPGLGGRDTGLFDRTMLITSIVLSSIIDEEITQRLAERPAVDGSNNIARFQQHTPLRHSPHSGLPLMGPATASRWRSTFPGHTWRFNPWTGMPRHALDLASDPFGLLIVPPGELLYAATKEMPSC